MKETAEMLLKRTRNELAEMAEKLGISAAGMPKPTIARFILEARKKAGAKGTPKPKVEPKYKAEVKVPPAKAQPRPSIGKKGVLAKRAAIDAQIKENGMAAEMMGAGVKELQEGIEDMRSSMDLKAREILHDGTTKLQKGVREMHKGIKEVQSAIDKKTTALQAGVEEMYSGVKEIQNGIKEMENAFREFQNETANYIKDFYYG